jgi:hypothetical protein
MHRVDDFYFGPDAWEPRATEVLEEHDPNTFVKPASLIKVTTTFVQFADGSTWGDDADGKRLIAERQVDLDQLIKLAQLHDSAGKEEFASALMKEESGEFPVIWHLKHTYEETGDTEAVMKEINLMLQHAKSREQQMAHNPSSSTS